MHTHRHYEKGESINGRCPTCRRSFRGRLGSVDFSNRLCRCGRPWNGTAVARLKNWMCNRKQRFTHDEANAGVGDIRMEGRGFPRPYLCVFCEYFHIGNESYILTDGPVPQ
jgi:hypothetical protein